ncbi:glycosyltransferase [Vibrio kanaloae]|uniref:glycosyltransferase n=1 Tax=Vibrio kanaloae TaxID=170673 RepID=UPI001F489B26|nr:glycosyltransferase [Vibrio kanaloae]UIJ40618.1 glycosyltransferase [Vibrio kanaloae]
MNQINLLINSFDRGGAEKVFLTLAKEIDSRNRLGNVYYVEKSSNELDICGVDVHFIGLLNGNNVIFRIVNYVFALFYLTYLKLKKNNETYLSFLLYSNLINIVSGIISFSKLSFISERSFTFSRLEKSKFYFVSKRIISFLYNRARVIICISNSLECELNRNGVKNTRVIYNPVTMPNLDCGKRVLEEKITLLSIGRLHPVKNQKDLIVATKYLENNFKECLIYGEGKEEHCLKSLAIELNVSEKCIFKGYQDNIYEKLIGKRLILINTSVSETFGNSVLEAMYCGVPVIVASSANGPVEIIEEGQFGLIYNIDNPEDLASKIQYLSSKKNYDYYSDMAKARASRFRLDMIIDEYFSALDTRQ